MAWIEVHQELRDHPKLIRLATRLKRTPAATLGNLVCLWLWASAYARDGDLSAFSSEEIAAACGDVTVINIEKYLIESHWIDASGEKKYLHDWKKHGIRILEQSKRRMRKYRKDKEIQERTVTQPLQNGSAYLSIFLSNLSNLSDTPLKSPQFAEAWTEWNLYRKEKKKSLTKRTAMMQLKFLSQQPDPVACLNQSIRQGWQGLFEFKENDETNQRSNRSGNRKAGGATTAADLRRSSEMAGKLIESHAGRDNPPGGVR